ALRRVSAQARVYGGHRNAPGGSLCSPGPPADAWDASGEQPVGKKDACRMESRGKWPVGMRSNGCKTDDSWHGAARDYRTLIVPGRGRKNGKESRKQWSRKWRRETKREAI